MFQRPQCKNILTVRSLPDPLIHAEEEISDFQVYETNRCALDARTQYLNVGFDLLLIFFVSDFCFFVYLFHFVCLFFVYMLVFSILLHNSINLNIYASHPYEIM